MGFKAVRLVDGDVVREDGRATYVLGTDAEQQGLENGLYLVKGEWFLKPEKGIDWFAVFELPYSRTVFETELRDYLNSHKRVKSIESIDVNELDRRNRTISADFNVTTISGDVSGSVLV